MNDLVKAIVPEREVVAIRTDGPHDHVVKVKLKDGTEEDAAAVIKAIDAHEAHYVMRLPDQLPAPLLIRSQRCRDCNETVLWA